ncbi:MAG: DUF11 domain-containing protein, partial [Clostridia bacterium]|nr:DUF11 domain-containing protein [Clostridia bacterium]
PPAYKDGCTFFSEKMSVKDISGKEHDDKIHAIAEKMAAQAPGAKLVQLGDAYTYFNANYASSKMDLYLRDLRSPSAAGSYYIACVLYASIFGKSPYGKEFSASLTADEAKLLQQAAHEFVFGSKPASAAKPSPYPIIKLEDDPRFKNQKFPAGYDAFLATAWAYYDRHICIQYDQRATDRLGFTFYRRTVDGTGDPEEGTPQKTLYLDCTAFVWSLLKSAYNYALPENRSRALTYNSTPELTPLIVYEHTPGTDRAEETVIQDIIETLQPGDVIAYSNPDNTGGHGVIYLGNGYVMQCSSSSRIGGGNADYNKNGNVDAHEGYGGIRVDKIDFLIDPHRLSYHFEPGEVFTTRIIRPDYSKLKPTEDAVNRAKNMLHIVAYKLTSAPEGVSVNPGDTVDFTIVVKNLNNEPRTVAVTDVLPAGLTLKSGSNNFTLSLAAGETKTQTYTVTVDASAKKDSFIEYKTTKAGGVTLNNTPVYVGSALSSADRQKLSAAATAATGASTFDVIKAAYDAIGVKLPFASADTAYSGVFKADPQYGSKGGICLNAEGAAAKTVARGIYGGRYFVNSNNEHRLKYVSVDSLIPGDILLAVEENNGKISYELYFYVADRTFKYVKDGKTVETSNSSDCQELIERVWGENAFAVIRPSLAK